MENPGLKKHNSAPPFLKVVHRRTATTTPPKTMGGGYAVPPEPETLKQNVQTPPPATGAGGSIPPVPATNGAEPILRNDLSLAAEQRRIQQQKQVGGGSKENPAYDQAQRRIREKVQQRRSHPLHQASIDNTNDTVMDPATGEEVSVPGHWEIVPTGHWKTPGVAVPGSGVPNLDYDAPNYHLHSLEWQGQRAGWAHHHYPLEGEGEPSTHHHHDLPEAMSCATGELDDEPGSDAASWSWNPHEASTFHLANFIQLYRTGALSDGELERIRQQNEEARRWLDEEAERAGAGWQHERRFYQNNPGARSFEQQYHYTNPMMRQHPEAQARSGEQPEFAPPDDDHEYTHVFSIPEMYNNDRSVELHLGHDGYDNRDGLGMRPHYSYRWMYDGAPIHEGEMWGPVGGRPDMHTMARSISNFATYDADRLDSDPEAEDEENRDLRQHVGTPYHDFLSTEGERLSMAGLEPEHGEQTHEFGPQLIRESRHDLPLSQKQSLHHTAAVEVQHHGPSPLDYRSSWGTRPGDRGHPERLALVDPDAGDPDRRDFGFAERRYKTMVNPDTGRSLKKPREVVEPGAAPGTVAFVDYALPDPNYLFVNYMKTRAGHHGQGHARRLMESLLERHPDVRVVDFGKELHPAVTSLRKSLQERHLDKIVKGKIYYNPETDTRVRRQSSIRDLPEHGVEDWPSSDERQYPPNVRRDWHPGGPEDNSWELLRDLDFPRRVPIGYRYPGYLMELKDGGEVGEATEVPPDSLLAIPSPDAGTSQNLNEISPYPEWRRQGHHDPTQDIHDVLAVQGSPGNWDQDPYMHGMLNGMELVGAIHDGREPQFREAPGVWGVEREASRKIHPLHRRANQSESDEEFWARMEREHPGQQPQTNRWTHLSPDSYSQDYEHYRDPELSSPEDDMDDVIPDNMSLRDHARLLRSVTQWDGTTRYPKYTHLVHREVRDSDGRPAFAQEGHVIEHNTHHRGPVLPTEDDPEPNVLQYQWSHTYYPAGMTDDEGLTRGYNTVDQALHALHHLSNWGARHPESQELLKGYRYVGNEEPYDPNVELPHETAVRMRRQGAYDEERREFLYDIDRPYYWVDDKPPSGKDGSSVRQPMVMEKYIPYESPGDHVPEDDLPFREYDWDAPYHHTGHPMCETCFSYDAVASHGPNEGTHDPSRSAFWHEYKPMKELASGERL